MSNYNNYKKIYNFMKNKELQHSLNNKDSFSYKKEITVTGSIDNFNVHIYNDEKSNTDRFHTNFEFSIDFNSDGINMTINDFYIFGKDQLSNDEIKNINITEEPIDGIDWTYKRKYSNLSLIDFKNIILNLSSNTKTYFGDSYTYCKDDMTLILVELVKNVIDIN